MSDVPLLDELVDLLGRDKVHDRDLTQWNHLGPYVAGALRRSQGALRPEPAGTHLVRVTLRVSRPGGPPWAPG